MNEVCKADNYREKVFEMLPSLVWLDGETKDGLIYDDSEDDDDDYEEGEEEQEEQEEEDEEEDS